MRKDSAEEFALMNLTEIIDLKLPLFCLYGDKFGKVENTVIQISLKCLNFLLSV